VSQITSDFIFEARKYQEIIPGIVSFIINL